MVASPSIGRCLGRSVHRRGPRLVSSKRCATTAYGFAGTLTSFLGIARPGLGELLLQGRAQTGGWALSPVERDGWSVDGPVLARFLTHAAIPRDTTYILLDRDIPGHLGRCDVAEDQGLYVSRRSHRSEGYDVAASAQLKHDRPQSDPP
jgi:hypothetical protein